MPVLCCNRQQGGVLGDFLLQWHLMSEKKGSGERTVLSAAGRARRRHVAITHNTRGIRIVPGLDLDTAGEARLCSGLP